MPDYTLKGYKSFMSSDGYAFSATVYADGKKIGTVSNGGYGGPNDYSFIDKTAGDALEVYAKSLPPLESELFPEGLTMDLDLYIDELINDLEEKKVIKRHCKTKTLFQLKGDAKGEWRVIKTMYSPKVAEHLRNKYPDTLKEIANETRA